MWGIFAVGPHGAALTHQVVEFCEALLEVYDILVQAWDTAKYNAGRESAASKEKAARVSPSVT